MQAKKLLNYSVLFLMLVLFPYLSWKYLKDGYDYRKNNLLELSNKTPVVIPEMIDTSMMKLTGKTSLLISNTDSKVVESIFDQFKDAPGFQLIADYKPDNLKDGSNWVQIPDSLFNVLVLSNAIDEIALIDTEGNIRRKYNSAEKDYLKTMVIHTTTLLPFTK